MLVFLSVIENMVVPPFDHLFCCFRPRARCFYSQLKRDEKSFIMPGHYKKIMPTQHQSERAYYCSHIVRASKPGGEMNFETVEMTLILKYFPDLVRIVNKQKTSPDGS